MTHQNLLRTLRGRTLRVAAAGSAIAAAAAFGSLTAPVTAHAVPDSGLTASDEGPVTGTPTPPTTSEPGADQPGDQQGEHTSDREGSGDQAGEAHQGDREHAGDGDHSGGDGEHEGD